MPTDMFIILYIYMRHSALSVVLVSKRKRKSHQIGLKKIKLTLFTDNMIIYIENPLESTKKKKQILI